MIDMMGMFTVAQVKENNGESTKNNNNKVQNGLNLKEVIKNGKLNGKRAGGKGLAFNLDTIKTTADKYGAYQNDYIDAYTKAFNEARNASSEESIVRAKAKHNGTNAARNSDHYNEKRLKKASEKYKELATVYYDSYVEAYNLKHTKLNQSKIIKSKKKISSLECKDHSQPSDSLDEITVTKTKRLNMLVEALDSLSEFNDIDLETAVNINHRTTDIQAKKTNNILTPYYINSQTSSDSSIESSSDSEEFSFARIKKMKFAK